MSRFDEDLDREFPVIAERATPSPDAWASIQQRIADREPTRETEIIMLTDNTLTTRRWPLVAAAAAVAALAIAGVALVNRGDDTEIPADPPTPTVPPAPETTVSEVPEPDADALPRAGSTLSPGRYASDVLGVPIALDLDAGQTAAWTVLNNEPGRLWFISSGSDQEFVAIGRLSSWYDATEARTEDTTGVGNIPADDVDGWIEQNGIIVLDRDDIEVGGRPAKYRQFRLDTAPGATADFCGGSAPCLWATTGSTDIVGGTANPIQVGLDRAQSLWVIDMDGYEPMYVFAAARLGEDGDQQWFDEIIQPIVDSIDLGAPAPTVEGGTARVPERVTLDASITVDQTGEKDLSAPWPVERSGIVTGDIEGTYTGTGVSSPNGAEVTLDWTMDVTIEGFGSGTLLVRSYWVFDGENPNNSRDHVLGGTGDLAGVTGFGTGQQVSDLDGVPWDADIELYLTRPSGA